MFQHLFVSVQNVLVNSQHGSPSPWVYGASLEVNLTICDHRVATMITVNILSCLDHLLITKQNDAIWGQKNRKLCKPPP